MSWFDGHKPLRDTILRSFNSREGVALIGNRIEFCDFEEGKMVKSWFSVETARCDEDYDNTIRICFEL